MAHRAGQHAKDLLIFRRVLRQARPYAWQIAGILGLSLLSTPLALLMPFPLKIVVDTLLGDDPVRGFLAAVLPARLENSSTSLLWPVVALLLFIALLNRSQALTLKVANIATGERLMPDFCGPFLRHAQRLSLEHHDETKGSSDSVYRIPYDGPALRQRSINATLPLFTWALTLMAMVVLILRIAPGLALGTLVVSPIVFGLSKLKERNDRW